MIWGNTQQTEPQLPDSEEFQALLEALWEAKLHLSFVSAIYCVWIKVQRHLSVQKAWAAVTTTYTNQVLWHNSEQTFGVDYSSFPYSATMTNARFRWSLKQGFQNAVHGTETTEIDCRCSKQPWQMNVPSINIWKVNKGNKSVQRMGKKELNKGFLGCLAWAPQSSDSSGNSYHYYTLLFLAFFSSHGPIGKAGCAAVCI